MVLSPLHFVLKAALDKVNFCHRVCFNLYVNDLIFKPRHSGLGCHICNEYAGYIFLRMTYFYYLPPYYTCNACLICVQSIVLLLT